VTNPHYWDAENVGLKGIRFLPISNPYTEARMYFAGQIHATYSLAPEMIEYARDRAPEALRQEPYLGTMFLRINVEREGLRDPLVRKALSLAIDRQSIIDNILKGGQVPATGVVPPFQGYAPFEAELLNIGRAKELLAEAGHPGGKGLPQIKILTTDKDTSKAMAEAIQAMWSDIGIKVGIEQMEWTTYLETMQRGNYDVCVGGWIGDFLDPTTFLDLWQAGDGNNNTNWANPAYDQLLKDAQQVKDPAERLTLLRRAEAMFMNDQPILPIYWYTINYLMDPSVEGWEPLLLNNHPYKFVRFAK
jgi:oligopeptide transport system substrate-binding protein